MLNAPVRPCVGAHDLFDAALYPSRETPAGVVRQARLDASRLCAGCPRPCDQPVKRPAPQRVGKPRSEERKAPAPAPVPKPGPAAACGTGAGYRKHRYHGETLCEDCTAAEREHGKIRTRTRAEDKAPCGTEPGHTRHVRYREKPCPDCLRAHGAYADGLRAELLLAERALPPGATRRDRARVHRLRYRVIGIYQPERVPHGTATGYQAYACRCPECLDAGHAVALARRKRGVT
jgi:hypothetical protein